MRKYEHIFFDLDHTLWDFDSNSKETLLELYDLYRLSDHGINDAQKFIATYREVNYLMWEEFRKNNISRETLRGTRFSEALKRFSVKSSKLSDELSHEYLMRSPYKKNLFAGALDMLGYLKNRGYGLAIITNGFEDVQSIKIRESGLQSFFERIIISEKIGYKKPEVEYFEITMKQHFCDPHECLVVGDNIQTDIIGAIDAGIDQVWFNPQQEISHVVPTFEISELSALKSIL